MKVPWRKTIVIFGNDRISFDGGYDFWQAGVGKNPVLPKADIVYRSTIFYKEVLVDKRFNLYFLDAVLQRKLSDFLVASNVIELSYFDFWSVVAVLPRYCAAKPMAKLEWMSSARKLLGLGFTAGDLRRICNRFSSTLRNTDGWGDMDVYHLLSGQFLMSRSRYKDIIETYLRGLLAANHRQ